VTVCVLPDEPEPISDLWEDVCEVSVECAGQVAVGELIDGPTRWIDTHLGTHRLRVSARGRTESAEREGLVPDDDDTGHDEPVEHYRLELWPAAEDLAPSIIREHSRYSRDIVNPPVPRYPPAREAGLIAARRVAADLRRDPGCRQLSGATGALHVTVEVAGTPMKTFNRVRFTRAWPPGNGGALSPYEKVGDQAFYYGDPPDSDGLAPLLGIIETEVIAVDKPRRLVKAWNWQPAGCNGTGPRPDDPRLLAEDSVVTMTFTKSNSIGGDPRTLIAVDHVGVPTEWVDDLDALWRWDIANYAGLA
jgi:hypothetical protein